jgi:SHOCT-like protein
MGDELTTILRLVSEGKLSAEEAAPILDALGRQGQPRAPEPPPAPGTISGKGRGRRIRIQVTEHGRRAVDVRVPLAFASMAARMVPGIPDSYRALIEQAVESDAVGPIVDLAEDEDGDAVLISIE